MVADEQRNISDIEESEEAKALSDPLIDVTSEQLVLPGADGNWFITSLAPSFETFLLDPSNLLSTYKVPTYFQSYYNLST